MRQTFKASTLLSPKNGTASDGAVYIAPKELMLRWCCSRSQVDRIARREGLTRLLLGTGRNGMVRYVRSEVAALESRSMTPGGSLTSVLA